MYQLCQAGKNEEVQQRMKSIPKAQVNNSQRANSEEQEIGVCHVFLFFFFLIFSANLNTGCYFDHR